MKKLLILPIILGAVLGVISVAVSHVHPAVVYWTGMRVIANHVGYLLGALLCAYVNRDKFWKGFVSGALAIMTANASYYLFIPVVNALNPNVMSGVGFKLDSFIIWTVIGAVIAALSAAVMKFIFCRKKLLRTGALISWYAVMLYVVYWLHIPKIISRASLYYYIEGGYMTGYHGRHNFAGDIFEAVFSFILFTVTFIFIMEEKQWQEYLTATSSVR